MKKIYSNYAPTVSVFMPCYNQEDFIAAAIESVLAQSYTDWELIVGDDHSTDGTWAIVTMYQKSYPSKIFAFRNECNLGISGNCDEVLKRCSGKYVAFHAGDDLYLPDKLKRQVDVMESKPDCVLSYHNVEVFNSVSNEVIHIWHSKATRISAYSGSTNRFLKRLVQRGAGFIPALSVMVRRNSIPDDFTYSESLPTLSELNMWVSVLTNPGSVHYLPYVGARYRRHDRNVSRFEHYKEWMTFYGILESERPDLVHAVRVARAWTLYRAGVKLLLNNKPKSALAYISSSIMTGWTSAKIYYWLVRCVLLIVFIRDRNEGKNG